MEALGTSHFLSCLMGDISFQSLALLEAQLSLAIIVGLLLSLHLWWVKLHQGRASQCQVVRLSGSTRDHLGGDGQTTRHSGRISRAPIIRGPQAIISCVWTISLQYASDKFRGWFRWNAIYKSCIDLRVYQIGGMSWPFSRVSDVISKLTTIFKISKHS